MQQASLCREHHITGFPSIRVFRSGHDDITVHGMRDHEVAARFHNQASHVHPCRIRNTADNGTPHGVARQRHMLDLPMCFGAPASWAWLATYSLKPLSCHTLHKTLGVPIISYPYEPRLGVCRRTMATAPRQTCCLLATRWLSQRGSRTSTSGAGHNGSVLGKQDCASIPDVEAVVLTQQRM